LGIVLQQRRNRLFQLVRGRRVGAHLVQHWRQPQGGADQDGGDAQAAGRPGAAGPASAQTKETRTPGKLHRKIADFSIETLML
jgi:hypothetical protein